MKEIFEKLFEMTAFGELAPEAPRLASLARSSKAPWSSAADRPCELNFVDRRDFFLRIGITFRNETPILDIDWECNTFRKEAPILDIDWE